MITGEFVGKLNIQKFAETLAKLVGEQYNVSITVKSIRRKDTMIEETIEEDTNEKAITSEIC